MRLRAPLLPAVRSFLSRHKRAASFVQRTLDRVPRLQDALLERIREDPADAYRRWVATYDTLGAAELAAMRAAQGTVRDAPLLSLLSPADEALKRSLSDQLFERWELRPLGSESAAAWNGALESAASDHVVLVEPGVVLRPHALLLVAQAFERDPDAVLVYADEDEIDEHGVRSAHYFKPDWNPALLLAQNYLGGFVAFRRSQALAVGGFDDDLGGDRAWSLFLRLGADAAPSTIHHLPFVLSHRRVARRPDAADAERRRPVARAIAQRAGAEAEVEPVGERSYRIDYSLPEKPPRVTVIVPSTGRPEILRPCLDGLLHRTDYPDFNVLLVVGRSADRTYLDELAARSEIRVLTHDDDSFNFSRLNNRAVDEAEAELLCFLNDDTEVIAREWLSRLVAHVLRDGVAAAGAMLLYPNGRIQHAGVVVGSGGVAAHNYARKPADTPGYHDRALVAQDVSCVTAACMVVRRDVFLDIGRFDEALALAYNDIDLCLRLRAAGWRIVWTPSARLYHRESTSTGRHDADEREEEWERETSLMRSRWARELNADPHYNPNLSLDPLYLWQPAFPPRIALPWHAAAAEHAVAQTVGAPARSSTRA